MCAMIMDRKTKEKTIIKNVSSAFTHYEYISINTKEEDGTADNYILYYREVEVQLMPF